MNAALAVGGFLALSVAAVAYALAAARALSGSRRRVAMTAYLGLMSVVALVLATRAGLAAALGAPPDVELDRALVLAMMLAAAMTTIPIMHLAFDVVLGDRRVANAAGWITAVVVLGCAPLLAAGLRGSPPPGPWGWRWTFGEPATANSVLVVLVAPFLFALAATFGHAARVADPAVRRRTRLVRAAILLSAAALTPNAYFDGDGWEIWVALALPGAALMAMTAYATARRTTSGAPAPT